MSERIKIPRSGDKLLAKVFREIGEKYSVPTAAVSALGFAQLGAVNLSSHDGDWGALLDHNSTLIETMSFSVAGLHIAYYRGGNYSQEHKSAIYDELVVTHHQQVSSSVHDRLEVIALLSKKLKAFEPSRAISGLTEEQSQLLAIHQSTLERLEVLNEELISKSAEFRQGLEKQYAKKSEENEELFRQRQSALQADIAEKLEDVERRKADVEAILKKIDDRNNTHVRREIRDRMLDDVRSRISKFGVSDSTASKRRPVELGILSMVLAFTALLIWTGFEIHTINGQAFRQLESLRNISSIASDPAKLRALGISAETIAKASVADVDRTAIYLLWARFAAFSFGLFGSILYYIKWQNRWAEQHSSAEFQLQQFYVDVNRANWVIESCLEWRKETASAIPRELLQSITNGLFAKPDADNERILHPADELASALVGSASKLKLNLNGNEVEFNKPGKSIVNKVISKSRDKNLNDGSKG